MITPTCIVPHSPFLRPVMVNVSKALIRMPTCTGTPANDAAEDRRAGNQKGDPGLAAILDLRGTAIPDTAFGP